MQRDCGPGPLIPSSLLLAWNIGLSDTEHKARLPLDLSTARQAFSTKLAALESQPGSNVRLYACDKAGYANCILSAFVPLDPALPVQLRTDRTQELVQGA